MVQGETALPTASQKAARVVVPPRTIVDHDRASASGAQHPMNLFQDAPRVRRMVNDAPAPHVIKSVLGKSHLLRIHLQHGSWQLEQPQSRRGHLYRRSGQID